MTTKCPIDDTELVKHTSLEGFEPCGTCGREWYYLGEDLCSRRRRVKIVAPIVEGARLDDCIKPINDWPLFKDERKNQHTTSQRIQGMYKVPQPPYETFKNPTCKGCFALGNACGKCEKCEWERKQQFPSEANRVLAGAFHKEPEQHKDCPICGGRNLIYKGKTETGGHLMECDKAYHHIAGPDNFSPPTSGTPQ